MYRKNSFVENRVKVFNFEFFVYVTKGNFNIKHRRGEINKMTVLFFLIQLKYVRQGHRKSDHKFLIDAGNNIRFGVTVQVRGDARQEMEQAPHKAAV